MYLGRITQAKSLEGYSQLLGDSVDIKPGSDMGGRYLLVTTGGKIQYITSFKHHYAHARALSNKPLSADEKSALHNICDLLEDYSQQATDELKLSIKMATPIRKICIIFSSKVKRFFGNVLPGLWGRKFKEIDELKVLRKLASIPDETRRHPLSNKEIISTLFSDDELDDFIPECAVDEKKEEVTEETRAESALDSTEITESAAKEENKVEEKKENTTEKNLLEREEEGK